MTTTINIFNPSSPSSNTSPIYWDNLPGANLALALSSLIKNDNQPIIVIIDQSLTLARLIEEVQFFLDGSIPLLQFPDWETLPYDHFSPHQDIISERLTVLNQLPLMKKSVLFATISTIMQRLPPPTFLTRTSLILKIGDVIDIDPFKKQLINSSYIAVREVKEHGEFAIRGSIIDLFPMGSSHPFRIDLFDNTIDSIRIFSPETQLSSEKINSIHLLPGKEFPMTKDAIDIFREKFRANFPGNPLKSPLYQDVSEGITPPGIEYYLPLFFKETAQFTDYLPVNSKLVFVGEIDEKAKLFWQEINHRYESGKVDVFRPLLKPEEIFLSPEAIKKAFHPWPKTLYNPNKKVPDKNSISFAAQNAPNIAVDSHAQKPLKDFEKFLYEYDGRILVCAETLGRREVLSQLFKTINFYPTFFETWSQFLNTTEQHGLVIAPLEQGLMLNDPSLTLVTETQFYGQRVMQRRLRKKSTQDPDLQIRNLTELKVDDPIVHINHGVGRYRGLQTLKVGDQLAEFLCLEYQNNDKLYVPVSSLHLVGRYVGSNNESAPMNRLGNPEWNKIKEKTVKKIKDVAILLLDLYARRAAKPGFQYSIPEQYETFAAEFQFEETPDQRQAIEAVLADLNATKPMDRVICGDVGFGKTEVALRAAFVVAMNGKQVILLSPTTLLAQQHAETFQDRLAQWPFKIETLSRFKTAKEQQKILADLQAGQIDIIIGTHKLLQKNINLKNLGLVIIDEEHRFGVKQKEKLKAMRSSVDILTLTATPIPRTLNMALSGMRDLSIIATPPAKRLSVKTFIHEYNNQLIQEAIQREVMRGGQVYFLHNEVSTIDKKAHDLSMLVKEARVSVAHGQMHERELENIMSKFYHRQFNVLVCSTIIESGIDIPTANTIIINRADKFGIAQLHQLRGRVGRSHHQAYAYLLVPEMKYISSDAKKRLDAIVKLDQLGIGFTLATHDLEIRGAGELLGEEQSGNIQEIGFTLYMDLLSKAVDSLKQGKTFELEPSLISQESEVDLKITALIPSNYIHDVELRLQFYKRISSAKTIQGLDEIQVEMIDRFGLIPDDLKNLFALIEIKLEAMALGIIKIEASDLTGKIEFEKLPRISPETIIRMIQKPNTPYKMEGPTRLRFSLPVHHHQERIALIRNILSELRS